MQPSPRWRFALQVLLLVLAAGGWASFAAAWLRWSDAERAADALRAEAVQAFEQAAEIRESSQRLVKQQESLIRLHQDELGLLRQRLALREEQLRKFGALIDPPRSNP